MTPLSNFVRPTIQFKSVVLPQPLGPKRPYLKKKTHIIDPKIIKKKYMYIYPFNLSTQIVRNYKINIFKYNYCMNYLIQL